MRKRNKVLFGIASCLFLTACAKEVDGAEKINDILKTAAIRRCSAGGGISSK